MSKIDTCQRQDIRLQDLLACELFWEQMETVSEGDVSRERGAAYSYWPKFQKNLESPREVKQKTEEPRDRAS